MTVLWNRILKFVPSAGGGPCCDKYDASSSRLRSAARNDCDVRRGCSVQHRSLRPMPCLFHPAALACMAIVILLTSGCTPSDSVSNDTGADKVTAVKTVAVTQTEIRPSTVQPASVHAFYEAQIHANASGFVGTIGFDIGDPVRRGDVLATIEVPEMLKRSEVIRARINRLKAEENRAAAGVDLARAQVTAAEAKLAETKSQKATADASLAAAEAEFKRTEDLVSRGSLQDRMLDEVRERRDSRRAAREAVTSLIKSAEANVVVAQAQASAAIADKQAAEADTEISRRELEELQVMIDYASVKAPFDGVVTLRNVDPGDLVGAEGDVATRRPMFVVSQLDKVRVQIPVPETDAARIRSGDQVTLTFPSYRDEPSIVAGVTRTSESLDPSTRTMLVEVELDNADRKLLPGMFGQAKIESAQNVAANLLPARAIRFDAEGKAYVYLVQADQSVAVTPVETGIDDGSSIQITGGIGSDAVVIDAHLKRFTDGEKVAVVSSDPSN